MSNTEFKNMEVVINQGAELFVDAIRDEAISKGLFKTGTLARSYESQVVYNQGKFQIVIKGIDYGDFQDKGVKGLRAGQSLAGYQFKSQAISPNSGLPFPVRVHIAQNGLKPKNFIQPAIDKVVTNFLSPKLEEAGVKDVESIVTTFAHGNKVEIK